MKLLKTSYEYCGKIEEIEVAMEFSLFSNSMPGGMISLNVTNIASGKESHLEDRSINEKLCPHNSYVRGKIYAKISRASQLIDFYHQLPNETPDEHLVQIEKKKNEPWLTQNECDSIYQEAYKLLEDILEK